MPKIFKKKSQSSGLGDDDQNQDDMTINSGWSVGGSVSDRIMGRMKMNLSSRNLNTSASASSGASVGSRKSTGRFNAIRTSARNHVKSSATSVDGGTNFPRSSYLQKYRSAGVGLESSVAGVDAMEEMDSTEAMALKGQSMGGRRSSRDSLGIPQRKLSKGKGRAKPKFEADENNNNDEPVECSLEDLRSMSEAELEQIMREAGVPSRDISSTLDAAATIDANVGTLAEDQRRNLLVALFVNSGHVKLVPNNRAMIERHTAMSSLSTDSMRDIHTDAMSIDDAPSVKSGISKNDKARKSKLEKIAELKTDNTRMKRENKSLKKTVKKLLGQLSNAINEKEELQKTIDEEAKKVPQSLGSIDETTDTKDASIKTPLDIEHKDSSSFSQQPPYDVVAHFADSETGSIKSGRSKMDASSRQSISSEKSMSKSITYLKRKYKKEKESHQNTEFRLKAEIDILTKEVDGLQHELAISLESLDTHKRRSRESRDTASSFKHELRNATTKVKELTAEAEARDKLIETFSKILLQKVGLEEGEGVNGVNVGGGDRLGEEEKLQDGVMMGQMDESFGKLKMPMLEETR